MNDLSEKQELSSETNSHQFSLWSTLNAGLFNVMVDFTPARALDDRRELRSFSILPHFNNDRLHYTDGFCTPYEGVYRKKQLARFQEKMKTAGKEISEKKILVPKPRQKPKRKCFVCFQYFEDYLEHTESVEHRTKMRNHIYSKMIKELAVKWTNKDKDQQRVSTRSMRDQAASPKAC